MARLILIGALMAVVLGGCSNKASDLKSPCVGNEGSPCARRPVNVGQYLPPDQA